MRKTICALVAAVGMAGCGNNPDYSFSEEIEGNKVSYKVPNIGWEHLTVTGKDKVTKEYFFGGVFDGEDTADFLENKIDLFKFCVIGVDKEEKCFRTNSDDLTTYPEAFDEANKQARYWINRILEVKKARALDLVKEAEKK